MALPTAGKILIVDDDVALQALYADFLTRYDVVVAADGAAAMYQLVAERPDLILLDLRLPDVDGLVLLTIIRRVSQVPIILCSARHEQVDRVMGLNSGADDFIDKPFDLDDMEARIEAVLRRSTVTAPDWVGHSGKLTISDARGALFDGKNIGLTPIEHRLLLSLALHAGTTVNRGDLIAAVWSAPADAGMAHLVTVYMGRLRAKLRRFGPDVPVVFTVRNQGYRLGLEYGSLN